MNNASTFPVKKAPPGSACSQVMRLGLLRKAPAIAKRRIEYLLIPLALLLFLGLWSLVVRLGDYAPFILPSPLQVYERFLTVVSDGSLWRHIRITLVEIFWGLALGLSLAISLGYLLAKSRLLERILSPYIVAFQAIPIIALAPLLVIWFGYGSLSKILTCALVVFFPVLINTIVGIRDVEQDLVDLMRSLEANRWQTFIMLEVPAALPVLFGGLRIGVTLSVIGAVVGEFVGADRGLGFLVNLSGGLFDTRLTFVALFVLGIIAISLYLAVAALESFLLSWKR
ncbi:MAG: ABC transporter permease [Anaerolineae bacterium]